MLLLFFKTMLPRSEASENLNDRRTAPQVSPGPSAPRENLWDLGVLFPPSTPKGQGYHLSPDHCLYRNPTWKCQVSIIKNQFS